MPDPEAVPPWRTTVTGRVDVTALLRDGERRTVRVCLPEGYETSGIDHPVLYMFDGHSLFDRATTTYGVEWGIDETVAALHADGRLPQGLVVVGVDAPSGPFERYREYTAWDWAHPDPAGVGTAIRADGAATADFLVGTVVPYVQATYRVARDRSRVGLAGSSMGGYMTLYTGTRHSEVFGRLLAFSPVMLDDPMHGDRLRTLITASGFEPDTWVYLDMGDQEELSYSPGPHALVADLARTAAAVAAAVRPPDRLVSRVLPGAPHDEDAWGARFGEVVLWAFAGGPEPA